MSDEKSELDKLKEALVNAEMLNIKEVLEKNLSEEEKNARHEGMKSDKERAKEIGAIPVDTSYRDGLAKWVEHEIPPPALSQTDALISLADSVKGLTNFLTNGGLAQVLTGYAKTQSVAGIVNGLMTKEGRAGLDARTMKQNAVEISTFIEGIFDHYQNRLKDKHTRDPELKDAEADFNQFTDKQK